MAGSSVDRQVCPGAAWDDLDPQRIESYRQELERRRPGAPQNRLPAEELLGSVGAVADGVRLRPTLSGMLFFGRDPQQFYPSFTITLLHFAGTSATALEPGAPLYLDNREFRGVLPAMIDATRASLYDKLGRQARISGFVRHDVAELPEFAYREAIVNAASHRDYALTGSSIQIRLFADRLEVQSPGGLGGNLTVDNILYEQYTRNPHIVRLLEDYGLVERRGLGVDRMIEMMTAAGLGAPSFQNRGSSFWVTLRREPPRVPLPDLSRFDLNPRQVRAVEYLVTHDRISNREYQQEFGVSERTALYDLQGLVDCGLALPVSSGRGRTYLLKA